MIGISIGTRRRRIATLSLASLAAVAAMLCRPARAQDVTEKVPLCAACHGENGVPQDSTMPVIWGQQAGYLYLQLRDYQRGTRKNDLMAPVVEGMQRDEMMALAEYFSKKPWPSLRQPPAPPDVAAVALRANTAIGCTGCHLGEYQGDGTQPRLAGQRREYMERTMLEFRDGTRGNNPGMSDLMKAASKEDIAAAAQYLAGR